MIYDLQKAGMWKRISAFLFDIIMLSIVATAFAFLFSVILRYDVRLEAYQSSIKAVEEKYGVTMDISKSEYEEYDAEKKETYDAALAELKGDAGAVRNFTLLGYLSLIMVTGGILMAYLLLEFFVPLWLKNGQTFGKKIFGIAVMRTNGVKVSGPIMFIRTVLGKFAVETMISTYIIIMFLFGQADIIMIILFFLIPIASIITMIATRTNSPVHDLLAQTVVVDLASQMIFDTEEDMIEYKKKKHRESVENDRSERPFSGSNK